MIAEKAQLAVYLTARAIDGRHVEGPELSRLQRADAVQQVTRRALNHGRGNVTSDILATQHESSRRCLFAQRWQYEMLPVLVSGGVQIADRAAIAAAVKSGVCADYASLAVCALAPGLQPDERVQLMRSPIVDHAWAEMRYGPTEAPGAITIDGWAQGPAIFSEDNATIYNIDAESNGRAVTEPNADAITGRFITTFACVSPAIQQQLPSELFFMAITNVAVDESARFEPVNTMDHAFARRAQAKMAHGPDGAQGVNDQVKKLLTEGGCRVPEPSPDVRNTLDAAGNSLRDTLAAVAAARTTGANVSGAVAQAPVLLTAVRNLPDIPNDPQPVRSR